MRSRCGIGATSGSRGCSIWWTGGGNDAVQAWVKNDHIGFELLYVYRGVVRKYRPDFLVRLKNGDHLVLETKGQDTEQDKVKRRYLDEWTQAVNAHGGFGRWRWAVAKAPGEIRDILGKDWLRDKHGV